MSMIANMSRRGGDPRILRAGPSSLGAADRLARALGWFSIGLGVVQMLAPRRVTRALGMQGQEGLMRAYGAREVASGVLALSVDPSVGLRSRIVGDAVDAATLAAALRPDNPKRDNVLLALAMVAGVTMLDIMADRALQARHGREQLRPRHRLSSANRRGDRSGFPLGLARARGAAGDFVAPEDFRPPF